MDKLQSPHVKDAKMEMESLQEYGSSKCSYDRKTLEKKRRNKMKALCSDLNNVIISNNHSKETISMSEQIDEAVNYIKTLEEKLEKLREKKECLMGIDQEKSRAKAKGCGNVVIGGRAAEVQVRRTGSALEVVVISGSGSQSIFFDIIRALHEEGATVVNASFCVVNDNIVHTIHSEVEESAFGDGVSRITTRLKNFIEEFSKCSLKF
ncbi:hypothetical protein Sjap_025723 [Stephania japonica]|uniref:BHLH domain-containing protein n=1 Tax=Stephania japonica TaxID=461633 RepID=A0AAP0E5Q1_9MAGN